MAYDIGPRIGIDGEKEFRKEIQNINAQMRALAAEAKTVQEAYKGQEESAESLDKKTEVLEKQIKAQREALKKLQDMLAKSTEKYGENDEKTQKWQETVNKATARLKSFEKQLKDVKTRLDIVSESFEASGQKLNQMGNTLTTGLTVPLAAAGAASVKYASDTEESLNKVDVAFGESAKEINDWSKSTLTSIGLARGTSLDMAALFGDMATSMGFSKDAAADMSMELVNLSGDLSSFKNVNINEVATALKSIFTGETESLKNLGVVMTEVNLEAFAMAQGFQKAYSEMDQTEKVALRYQYVMEMTKNAQGDFARTFDSTANQTRVLQESLKEAAATLGQDLLPIVTPVIQKLASLVQKFSELDEGTRKNIVQIALFLATLGPMLKLTGGITSATSTLINLYKSLKATAEAAAAGQSLLNAAMSTNVIGAVITAVATLISLLASLAISTSLAGEKQNEYNEALKEAKTAHEETVKSLENENTKTLAMIANLEQLIAAEEQTSAQKQQILNIVNELNEAIPNLSLAYDEQTNSLNMTAEAIRNLAEAEAIRKLQEENYDQIVEQTSIRIQAEKDLAAAETELSEVKKQLAIATSESNAQMEATGGISRELQEKIANLGAESSQLNDEINAANDTILAAQATIDLLTGEIEELSTSTETASDTTKDFSAINEEAKQAEEGLRSQTSELVNEINTLSKAFEEQANAGTVSLDTALKLIDAGYSSALAFDTETGAIDINREAFIQLTKAKIEDQIAEIERKREAEKATIQAQVEAASVADVAVAYFNLASAIAASNDRVKSYDAQIAALEQLKNSIGKYTGSVRRAASTTKRSVEKTVTAAEKELNAYKENRKEIDHLLAMGQITEKEYYDKLAQLRDRFLTDKENIDEYRKINEEIYKNDQELAEKEDKLWAEQTNKLTEEIQNRFDEVIGKRDEMSSKLGDYGDLFTLEEDNFTLASLDDQLQVLNKYDEILTSLKNAGLSDGLLGEITNLDVDDAIRYGEELLKLTDEDLDAYNSLWEEKQEKALEIASKFYSDQLEALKTEYGDKLGEALDGLQGVAFGSGIDTAQGLANGIAANSQAAIDAARKLAQAIESELNFALGIHSPSTVTEQIGRYTAQGFEVGFVDEMGDVKARMVQSASPADAANQAASGVVNGLSGVLPAKQGGIYEITVKVGAAELANVLFDPLKGIIRQKGESL